MIIIEVVFIGLCAIVFDDGMKPKGGYADPGKPQPARSEFEALLPRDAGHDPELWIQCIDLEGGCAGAKNLGSCEDSSKKCVEWQPLSTTRMSTCKEQADVYAVWCLEDTQVKFKPLGWSQQTFEGGYRPDPADSTKRHFGNKKPGAVSRDQYDASWIGEPAKAFGGGRLNPDHDATTRVVGLRGGLWTAVVPGKKALKDSVVWDWCYPVYNSGVLTECNPDPGRLPDYDQTLTEAAAIDVRSGNGRIVLNNGAGANNIDLKKTTVRPKVYIQNIPRHADLKPSKHSGQDICVAEHFKHYAELLTGYDPANVRLPWRRMVNGDCVSSPLDGAGEVGKVYLVTDSFCPPGGISRNP